MATSERLSTAALIPKLRLRHSLTLRGVAFLLFLVYLVLYLIPREVDIVGAVLGYTFLSLFVCLVFATVILGVWLRSRIAVTILGPKSEDNKAIESRRLYQFLVTVSEAPVPPLFVLRMSVVFEHPEAPDLEHVISGWSNEQRFLEQEIRFAHRGEWECSRIEFSFEDQLGLSRFGWSRFPIGRGERIRVTPPQVLSRPYPIVSSRQRSGDTLSDSNKRLGDPLDLKPYHPADGMRRIVWKIFAKTGELVSRHPEPAMTPEGETLVYVLASPLDDLTCAEALEYLEAAERQGIDFRIGCLGMSHKETATDYKSAQDLLVDSVWNTYSVTQQEGEQELAQFLDNSNKSEFPIAKIVIFVGSSLLGGEDGIRYLVRLAELLRTLEITPHFALQPESEQEFLAAEQEIGLGKLLLHPENKDSRRLGEFQELYRQDFLNICERNGWSVIVPGQRAA